MVQFLRSFSLKMLAVCVVYGRSHSSTLDLLVGVGVGGRREQRGVVVGGGGGGACVAVGGRGPLHEPPSVVQVPHDAGPAMASNHVSFWLCSVKSVDGNSGHVNELHSRKVYSFHFGQRFNQTLSEL